MSNFKKNINKQRGWQKISSKVIHKNKYFKLRQDKVVQPDGNKGEYFYIDNDGSVFVVAEDNRGRLILVGQSRYTADNLYSWEFVGGGIQENETALTTAKKELKEETGIVAKKWIDLGFFYTVNGLSNERCFIFLARDLHFGKANNEATEDIKIKKVSESRMKKMIAEEKITCGMTIATFYKYLSYKEMRVEG